MMDYLVMVLVGVVVVEFVIKRLTDLYLYVQERLDL